MYNLKKIKNNYDNLGFTIIKKILSSNDLEIANQSLIEFVSASQKILKGRDINFTNGKKSKFYSYNAKMELGKEN
jgi:hypothetical protein